MLKRLERRGVHVAESLQLDLHDYQEVEDREDALIKAFHALDTDRAQRLSVQQLRGLVCLDSPDVNQQQAGELLQELDRDADGLVNLDDWTSSWEEFRKSAPDSQFNAAVCAITHGLHMPVDFEPGKSHPRHPANNRAYCTAQVARLLEQGLAETITFLADQHVQAASKELWEVDGFLPPKFSQPCPVRFLAEWLQKHNPVRPCENDDPHQLPWDTSVPLHDLTPRMIFRAAFQHLDRPQTGYAPSTIAAHVPGWLDASMIKPCGGRQILDIGPNILPSPHGRYLLESAQGSAGCPVFVDTPDPQQCCRFVGVADVERLVASLPRFASPAQLKHALDSMDLDGLEDVKLEEFQEIMASLASSMGGWSITEGFRSVLTAYFLSLKDWEKQLRCLFDHLLQLCPAQAAVEDKGEAGEPGKPEAPAVAAVDDESAEAVEWAAVMAIARWKLQTHSPNALRALLGGVDAQHGPRFPAGAASFAPFCDAMNVLFASTDAAAAADELAALLTGAVELQAARGLPPALAARVRSHPLYARVPSMHAREVQAQAQSEAVSEVIAVDCRTGDEYDVSTALSALLCDMLQNPYTEHGWEADADALQEVQELAQEALDMPTAGRPLVVIFCTDGSRAALVAVKLMELLPEARVVNMVGGLLAWRAMGGELEGPDGEPTDELHPFSPDLEPFLAPWPLS